VLLRLVLLVTFALFEIVELTPVPVGAEVVALAEIEKLRLALVVVVAFPVIGAE
jgi:hypothetical protein